MTDAVVTLTQVEMRSAADLIVAQLAAYGIAAMRLSSTGAAGSFL